MKRVWWHITAVALAIAFASVMLKEVERHRSLTPCQVEIANREASPTLKRKGLLLCRDSVFDFGRVRGGDTIQAEFPVTNTSSNTVWIRLIESCACLRSKTDYRIEPGETIDVPVLMATHNAHGSVCKTIAVKTIAVVPPATRSASPFGRLLNGAQKCWARLFAKARCSIVPAK